MILHFTDGLPDVVDDWLAKLGRDGRDYTPFATGQIWKNRLV